MLSQFITISSLAFLGTEQYMDAIIFSNIVEFIKDLGFPIFVCLYLMFRWEKVISKLISTIEVLNESLKEINKREFDNLNSSIDREFTDAKTKLNQISTDVKSIDSNVSYLLGKIGDEKSKAKC